MPSSHGTITSAYNFTRTRVPQLGQSAPSTPSGAGPVNSENDFELQAGHGFMMATSICGETFIRRKC